MDNGAKVAREGIQAGEAMACREKAWAECGI